MTEAEWLSKPTGELLQYACSEIPTVHSQWLEVLWSVDSISSPPRRSSPWKIGSRGRKHWLLTLAITRLYWDYLSHDSRELLEWLQQNEERSELPSGDSLSGLYSNLLEDLLYSDTNNAPEVARLTGMGKAGQLSGMQWGDLDFDGPPEQYERWRPLLYDVFGNPFRPVAFSPEWRTNTVIALARQMHESRDFSAMPILADALQDAGCDNADILDHCRGPGPHVRGCWCVDLVLGRE
jgi:hypothetical protein